MDIKEMYNKRYRGSITNIISFYREQLRTFKKIGMGNKTRHGVIISETLINATERRLNQLIGKKLSRKSIGDYIDG